MKEASIYAGIVKMDENGDGTLTVYGKATDDSLDIDQQICDPVWLDKAMPEWFTTGGNIREQHSNIAAGVAEEYEKKADGHYITALVVDPVSVKKVKSRVLKGFSIGIKSPRVVKDTKAVNGRIIDGQIVEVSLVDRPANPNAKLVLAKSAIGEKTLIKTEEFIEKHGDHDQADHDPTGGGGSSSGERDDNKVNGIRESLDTASQDLEDAVGFYKEELQGDDRQSYEDDGINEESIALAESAIYDLGDADSEFEAAYGASTTEEHISHLESARDSLQSAADKMYETGIGTEQEYSTRDGVLNTINEIDEYLTGLSNKSITAEIAKGENMKQKKEKAVSEKPSKEEALKRLEFARKRVSKIEAMCKELGYMEDSEEKQYGETAEEETSEGSSPAAAEEEVSEARGEKPLDKELVSDNGEEEMKSATHKCLECGCGQPANSHGNPNVSTAAMVTPSETPVPTPAIQPPTPKSADTITPLPTVETVGTQIEEEDSDEEDSAEKSLLADGTIESVIEKAVKSAMASVQAEIAELKSAKEAVENKAASLETELATAKSLAIGGGPKRTTIATGAKTNNEWKAKANLYLAKASATTDNDLAKGYREMAKDFLAKADSEAQA